MSNVAIDFIGRFGLRYSVFDANRDGSPVHPLDCECRGLNKCGHWHFKPHSKQIEFFDAKEPYVLFGGGRGGGKTAALIWKPVLTAYLAPHSRAIVFRRTMGELKKTIIDGFGNLPKGVYSKLTDEYAAYDNGSKTWFGSADDEKAVRKLLSGEYDLMEFDEWSEWPLSMWKFAAGSCRSTRERTIFNQPHISQIAGGTNPGGIGGESLNALFGCDGRPKRQAPGEDPTLYDASEYRFIQSLVSDNPAYSEQTPAGVAYRKMLNSQPSRIRAAWLLGRWDGFEGQYFDCLDESATKFPHDEYLRLVRKQHWAPHWMSIDWGNVHHAYCAWHALIKIDGRDLPITYQEKLIRGLGEAALAEELSDMTELAGATKKITKIYLSPEIFGESAFSRAKRMGDIFVANKLPRPTPANNKREDGWRLMHDLLRQRHQTEDFGTLAGWLITDNCPHALESLPQAECDPKKDGDVKKEGDAPHLDVNDGLRYGIASHIRPIGKPFEDRVQEELEKLPVEGPSRYIRHLQLKQQEKTENPGVFYLGRRKR